MVSKYILIPKADLQWKFESAIPQPLTLLLDKRRGKSPNGLNMSPLFSTF